MLVTANYLLSVFCIGRGVVKNASLLFQSEYPCHSLVDSFLFDRAVPDLFRKRFDIVLKIGDMLCAGDIHRFKDNIHTCIYCKHGSVNRVKVRCYRPH